MTSDEKLFEVIPKYLIDKYKKDFQSLLVKSCADLTEAEVIKSLSGAVKTSVGLVEAPKKPSKKGPLNRS